MSAPAASTKMSFNLEIPKGLIIKKPAEDLFWWLRDVSGCY